MEISQAIEAYTHGIQEWNKNIPVGDPIVKAVLLSNRAACYLKLMNSSPSTIIQNCVDDCTEALELLEQQKQQQHGDHDNNDSIIVIRCKLLFRRSKALFLQSEETNNNNNKNANCHNQLMNEAAKDLLIVLSLDSGNHEAATLLRTIRAKHSMTKGTPISQTLLELGNAMEGDTTTTNTDDDNERVVYQLKVLLGLLTNDDVSTALELGRRGGIQLLMNMASVKSLQALACACTYPKFVREYGKEIDQRRLVEMVTTSHKEDVAVQAVSILVRLVLYLDDLESLEEVSLVDDMHIVHAITCDIIKSNTLLPARLDLLCSWTAVDRENVVQTSTEITLVSKKTEAELRSMKPREVAAYKKNVYERLQRDRKWAKERALLFCDKGGLEALLSAAVHCEDHSLRKHVGIVLGRLMASIQENEDVERVAKRYLGSGDLTIEEIIEEKTEIELSQDVLQKSMKRLQLTSSLLLGSAEVGSWALDQTKQEIRDMITSGDPKAMGIASEVVSAAASIEKSRPAITILFNNGVLDSLLEHSSHDIRSGAASAVAKLGLADKVISANEGEVIGLLQIAVDLLSGESESPSIDLISKATPLVGASSTASTAIERGIEIICYLASKTQVKEELAHSYKSSPMAKTTALESLVELANREGAGESISAYALATIFGLICVSSETLRKEAFIGKEMTMEQYDELQKLGKSEEEKESAPVTDDDSQTAVQERIRILANANVPRALVKLMNGASETTVEQIVISLNRMAIDVSVRGLMIQQGALSACIEVERGVSLYAYLQC